VSRYRILKGEPVIAKPKPVWKHGDKVIISKKEDVFHHNYSECVGYKGTVYKVVDEDYVIIFCPRKVKEGKPGFEMVPVYQIDTYIEKVPVYDDEEEE
jgi:hypothetical protein